MNPQNSSRFGQQPGNGQTHVVPSNGTPIQLPTKPASKLKRYKVDFLFDHPGDPGGTAVVVAADMASAAGIFFAQVHNVDLQIKHATFRAMDDTRVVPASILPHIA